MDYSTLIPIVCTAVVMVIQAVSAARIAVLQAMAKESWRVAEDTNAVVNETKKVADKVEVQTNSQLTTLQAKIERLDVELKAIREQQGVELAKLRDQLAIRQSQPEAKP